LALWKAGRPNAIMVFAYASEALERAVKEDQLEKHAQTRAALETVDATALARVSALALVHKWRAKAKLNQSASKQQAARCIAMQLPESTFHEGAEEAYGRCANALAIAFGIDCSIEVPDRSIGVLDDDHPIVIAFRAVDRAIDAGDYTNRAMSDWR
jgi:hypothetical protein